MNAPDYAAFLQAKTQLATSDGFAPVWMPDYLFDFHPLQLDVIERCVMLRSNPDDTVFTPFMGVGSEVYVPVLLGRLGVGVELKPSYYRQAVKNVTAAAEGRRFDRENVELQLEGHAIEDMA